MRPPPDAAGVQPAADNLPGETSLYGQPMAGLCLRSPAGHPPVADLDC